MTDTPKPPSTPPLPDHDDEIDIDLADDEAQRDAATFKHSSVPEGIEYLGEYASVEAYLRAMLEPEISTGCAWVLDHLDWRGVLARFEATGARYFAEQGHVYRTALG
jgi:hypothetical protein